MHRFVVLLSAIIFGIVAIIHALRLYYNFPVTIGTFHVPEWGSIVGLVVAGFLSIGLFSILKK